MVNWCPGIAAMPESRPKRRWYHITPDRLIVGLLAFEFLLLLSEWFQWFAFNEKKGYTVLIAVAAVCLVVVVMFVWLVVSLLFRWRFQFSLRSLVVLVVAVAVPLGWFGVKLREAERQRKAVEAIRAAYGKVLWDYEVDEHGFDSGKQEPPAPAWLRKVVGDDFFADVLFVAFHDPTKVGDVVLDHVEGLSRVKALDLSGTQLTDAEVQQLKGLTELEQLFLDDTHVTDVAVKHLKGLRRLEQLNLVNTQVTNKGINELRRALPDCWIS